MCPSGQLLASCSRDGSIALINPNSMAVAAARSPAEGKELEQPSSSCVHAPAARGASMIAFDASGSTFASAGLDGSLFVHMCPGEGHVVQPPGLGSESALSAAAAADVADWADEPTWAQQQEARQRQHAAAASQHAQQEVSWWGLQRDVCSGPNV